ncbi:hypothetical protein F8388_017508 [Cannabis sativa]|uniref:RNase H type-1 domain-containing protein n=1 Tax=Cannabis sativa TaxID=3483 RepID=A0A7J6G291_CANSA|nr:hypothetical protein F8388_017508 [Cannabis sativa]
MHSQSIYLSFSLRRIQPDRLTVAPSLSRSPPLRLLQKTKSWPPEISNNRDAPSTPETLRATTQPNHKRNPFEISNSTPLEAFFPRNSANDQSLQQAVDQFLRMDIPTTGFNSPVSSAPPLSHSTVTLMHTNPVSSESTPPFTKTTIPPPIMTTSVITHTDKGKGIAVPTSIHPPPPSTRPPGHVIYEPVSLTSPASSPGAKRSFTRQSTQAWSLWSNPDSLLYSLLKSRYFKHSDFLSAPKGYNSSFTWRSILWGHHLLKQGLVWRIFSGRTIPLSAPNWIPGISSHTILHPIDPHLSFQDTPALFVDAALDQDRGVTGIGCVLKIGPDEVIASTNSQKPGAPLPIFAEAQALSHGLSWCISLQQQPRIIFTDCLNLVSKVNGKWQDNSALSLIVNQIRQSFSNFLDASLVHLPREFNTTAHFLAREAIRLREDDLEDLGSSLLLFSFQ